MSSQVPPDHGPPWATAAWPLPALAGAPAPAGAAPADRRRFDSQQLFGTTQEVEIAHAGAIYRLRRTALGKLILTK